MTAIVGLVQDGAVHIGGDSAGIGGWSLTVRADLKVFENGPYIMGFTTSFRMGQLLRYSLKTPDPDDDLERFMATTFVDCVRDCLKDGGWMKKDSEREEGGEFLIGVRGRLFECGPDFQIAEAMDRYTAVGAGFEIALGALHATSKTRMAPRRRLRIALEAAERHSAAVRGPFTCLSQASP